MNITNPLFLVLAVSVKRTRSARGAAGMSSDQPPLGASDSRAKILIVDDTPANLRAFSAILEPDGYEIIEAASGNQALKLSLQHDFAVILLDVRMPVLTGLETAAALRGGKAKHTPIIFVSAYEKAPREVERGYLAGALDYLFSPVDPDTLRRKVSAFVDYYVTNMEYRRLAEALARTVLNLQEEIRSLKKMLENRDPGRSGRGEGPFPSS
jgi:CheY-like chemotaxis protein